MMIAKVLGVLDLTAVAIIILLHFGFPLGWRLVIFHIAFLVIKGSVFWGDWNSFADMFIGAYMVLMFLGVSWFFDWIIVAYLAQKGIVSLV